MCSFAEFNRPKLNLCTNLQKKHCIGEQICLVGMEHQNNAHHIRKMDFWDLPQIWKIFYLKWAHLLILTEQHCIFTLIYRKAPHWKANLFGGNGASK